METFICVTCGTQYPPSAEPPAACPICDDDRQYVGPNGQQWITLADLRASHTNEVVAVDPSLTGIATTPSFAIGQQAHLIQTPNGNVLWDCVSLLDDATIERVRGLGGVAAIAISHPHFFSSMVEWARAFDAPMLLHAEHRPWVMRPDAAIQFWDGDTREIVPGVTAIRCGGHFPGSTALHWADGAGGQGALFTADTITVVADRRWVSFMYSYPNIVPLDAASVRRIVAAIEPYPFARLYGGWRDKIVAADAKNAVRRSADRYIARISG
jgi:glyoxylase-like metal-dependent hydrolase (beta-lactamase superfamily II)